MVTSNSHWNATLWLADPPMKDNCWNHTWKPPCLTLQCEHAFKQEVVGRSKFTKVTFEMVSLGVLGVFIPPVCGSPSLIEEWEIMREFWCMCVFGVCKCASTKISGCGLALTWTFGPPHSPCVSIITIPSMTLSATLNPSSCTWPTTDNSTPLIPLA